jgi:hypothetical protein
MTMMNVSTPSGQQEWLHALELKDILIRSRLDECVVGWFPTAVPLGGRAAFIDL